MRLRVELDVSDNGPGLPIKFSNMRLSLMSRRSLRNGTGTCTIKKIAEEHGAMVAAENRKDADGRVCGARLTFVFHRLWHEQNRPN